MNLASALFLNALFLITLFCSWVAASAWGEMAGIQAGGDKSGLGGFMMLMIFMAMRWVGVALLLWVAVEREVFDFLPGGRWGRLGIVLLTHLAIGIACYKGFTTITSGLQVDNMGPQRWCWVFGLLLPLPVLLLAGWGVNREFFSRQQPFGLVLLVGILLLHVLTYRSRANDMRATALRLKTMRAQPQ